MFMDLLFVLGVDVRRVLYCKRMAYGLLHRVESTVPRRRLESERLEGGPNAKNCYCNDRTRQSTIKLLQQLQQTSESIAYRA